MYSLMLGGIPAPASRIMTLRWRLPSLFAIKAPAKPEPTIATSHTLSASPAMIRLTQISLTINKVVNVVRRARPITKLHLAEAHGVGLSDPQRPRLGISFRRNNLEFRSSRRVFGKLFAKRL